MLEVRDLNAYYGASHVLHDVTMRVDRGELVALLGRNGAGKTTTLSALMGTVRVRKGHIVVADADVSNASTYRRARKGLTLVPSGARVFPNLTVRENLEVVRGRRTDDGWTVERVFEAFPKLGDLRENMAGNLSGGERQMLAVGRGLMANPNVLLLDEPSEGLAPVVLDSIGELLAELRGMGLTMVLAEQNHRWALKHADRAYLIEKGAIQHEAPAPELMGSDALQRYLGV